MVDEQEQEVDMHVFAVIYVHVVSMVEKVVVVVYMHVVAVIDKGRVRQARSSCCRESRSGSIRGRSFGIRRACVAVGEQKDSVVQRVVVVKEQEVGRERIFGISSSSNC